MCGSSSASAASSNFAAAEEENAYRDVDIYHQEAWWEGVLRNQDALDINTEELSTHSKFKSFDNYAANLPSGPRRLENAPVTSAAKAFMGATYTTLKSCL